MTSLVVLIAIISILIIVVVYLVYRGKKKSHFTDGDKQKAFNLFDKTDGKASFSEFKTNINNVDVVDYNDLKSDWRSTIST